jgi:hypothetical protein
MIHEESSAPNAHPSTEDHDDTVEAHYASLERPHACIEGWVFVGYVAFAVTALMRFPSCGGRRRAAALFAP